METLVQLFLRLKKKTRMIKYTMEYSCSESYNQGLQNNEAPDTCCLKGFFFLSLRNLFIFSKNTNDPLFGKRHLSLFGGQKGSQQFSCWARCMLGRSLIKAYTCGRLFRFLTALTGWGVWSPYCVTLDQKRRKDRRDTVLILTHGDQNLKKEKKKKEHLKNVKNPGVTIKFKVQNPTVF